MGEKRAGGIGGFYDSDDVISISPADAAKLGVSEDGFVLVESGKGKAEFSVHVTDAVTAGVLSVGVNAHRNRALFQLASEPITGETTIPPAGIQVTKSLTTTKSAVEVIARVGQ